MHWLLVLWHGPGDVIAKYTTARGRRSFGAWVSMTCTVLWMIMPSAIWLIGLMSVVALWSVPAAETPVEVEGGEKIDN